MSIETELDSQLKDAMRAKDKPLIACIRQVRSKMQEKTNALDFTGEVNDALYVQVIGSYVKSINKAIVEMAAAGERTEELRDQYQAEVDFLQKYLPTLLGEAQTKSLVDATIASIGITDPKQSGRVMGVIMGKHKGEVDPALVKRLVAAAFA